MNGNTLLMLALVGGGLYMLTARTASANGPMGAATSATPGNRSALDDERAPSTWGDDIGALGSVVGRLIGGAVDRKRAAANADADADNG